MDEHVKLGGDQLLQLVVNSLSLFDFMQVTRKYLKIISTPGTPRPRAPARAICADPKAASTSIHGVWNGLEGMILTQFSGPHINMIFKYDF